MYQAHPIDMPAQGVLDSLIGCMANALPIQEMVMVYPCFLRNE